MTEAACPECAQPIEAEKTFTFDGSRFHFSCAAEWSFRTDFGRGADDAYEQVYSLALNTLIQQERKSVAWKLQLPRSHADVRHEALSNVSLAVNDAIEIARKQLAARPSAQAVADDPWSDEAQWQIWRAVWREGQRKLEQQRRARERIENGEPSISPHDLAPDDEIGQGPQRSKLQRERNVLLDPANARGIGDYTRRNSRGVEGLALPRLAEWERQRRHEGPWSG